MFFNKYEERTKPQYAIAKVEEEEEEENEEEEVEE